jgi:aspartyl-tRNA(Asn)/glutamyl-tRNA(Gln) amidotransferase subunit C
MSAKSKTKAQSSITLQEVRHIAKLANLPIKTGDESKLLHQFEETLTTVNKISELDTTGVIPTSQVTGLTNVMREDKIDMSRVLSQTAALSGAKKVHNGYFVVPSIINEN